MVDQTNHWESYGTDQQVPDFNPALGYPLDPSFGLSLPAPGLTNTALAHFPYYDLPAPSPLLSYGMNLAVALAVLMPHEHPQSFIDAALSLIAMLDTYRKSFPPPSENMNHEVEFVRTFLRGQIASARGAAHWKEAIDCLLKQRCPQATGWTFLYEEWTSALWQSMTSLNVPHVPHNDTIDPRMLSVPQPSSISSFTSPLPDTSLPQQALILAQAQQEAANIASSSSQFVPLEAPSTVVTPRQTKRKFGRRDEDSDVEEVDDDDSYEPATKRRRNPNPQLPKKKGKGRAVPRSTDRKSNTSSSKRVIRAILPSPSSPSSSSSVHPFPPALPLYHLPTPLVGEPVSARSTVDLRAPAHQEGRGGGHTGNEGQQQADQSNHNEPAPASASRSRKGRRSKKLVPERFACIYKDLDGVSTPLCTRTYSKKCDADRHVLIVHVMPQAFAVENRTLPLEQAVCFVEDLARGLVQGQFEGVGNDVVRDAHAVLSHISVQLAENLSRPSEIKLQGWTAFVKYANGVTEHRLMRCPGMILRTEYTQRESHVKHKTWGPPYSDEELKGLASDTLVHCPCRFARKDKFEKHLKEAEHVTLG